MLLTVTLATCSDAIIDRSEEGHRLDKGGTEIQMCRWEADVHE